MWDQTCAWKTWKILTKNLIRISGLQLPKCRGKLSSISGSLASFKVKNKFNTFVFSRRFPWKTQTIVVAFLFSNKLDSKNLKCRIPKNCQQMWSRHFQASKMNIVFIDLLWNLSPSFINLYTLKIKQLAQNFRKLPNWEPFISEFSAFTQDWPVSALLTKVSLT